MFATGRAARVVACLLGLVLISAGGLKLYAAARPDAPSDGPTWGALLSAATGGLELLFGGWLVIGLYPRVSRLVAIAVFIALSNVALFKALAEEKSCGCLGRVTLAPWAVAAFDALAVLALLLARPAGEPASSPARRHVTVGWVGAVVAAVLFVGLPPALRQPVVAGMPPTASEQDLLDRVCKDIEANHASYKTLQFEATEINRNVQVKEDKKTVTREPGGGGLEVTRYAKRTYRLRYAVAGPDVRRDAYLNNSLVSAETVGEEHWVDYMVPIDRAVVRPRTVHIGPAEYSLDRPTWGFLVPVAHPREWFGAVKVTAVREDRRDSDPGVTVEVESLPTCRYHPLKYVLFFSATRRHLPTHMEIWAKDGSIASVVDVAYRKVGPNGSWVVKSAESWLWGYGTTKTIDHTLAGHHATIVADEPRIDEQLPADHFKLKFPAGTWVAETVRGQGSDAHLTKPAAGPKEVLERIPENTKGPTALRDQRPKTWWPVALWNVGLLACGLVFRHRLVG